MTNQITEDEARIRDLAQSLNCLSEADFCLLADIAPGTAESWRKRRKGPAYVLFGNRYLYPRAGVAEHLQGHIREQRGNTAKALL